jgi:hypothetical protein
LPHESVGHDSDGMALALVFTDQDGAGFQAPVQFVRFLATRQAVEELDRLPIEPAERLLLEPVRDHARHDVLGQPRRRGLLEHQAPAPAKRVDAEGPDVVDLGLDRGRVYRPLEHGYAAGRSAAPALAFGLVVLPVTMR